MTNSSNYWPIACTVKDAVKMTGISRTKLYEAIKSGELPVRKCGTRTLIRYEDLAHFIEHLPQVHGEGGGHA